MKTVAIVGVNSALGVEIGKRHLAQGDQVIGYYNQRTNRIPEGWQVQPIGTLFEGVGTVDLIYILSAFIPYGAFNEPSEKFGSVNVGIPEKICEIYSNSRVIFASSVAVYGQHHSTIDEYCEVAPENLYAQSKLAGEKVVSQHPSYGIARISALYGPGMPNGFIARAIEQSSANGQITIFGDGRRAQNYIHISEAADYFIKIAKSGINDEFLVIGEGSTSNTEVAEIIANLIPGTQIQYEGSDNSASIYYDNSKTLSKIGTVDRVSLRNGIKSMIDNG